MLLRINLDSQLRHKVCPARKGDQHADGGPEAGTRRQMERLQYSNSYISPHSRVQLSTQAVFRASYSVLRPQFVLAYRISRAHSLSEISPPPKYGVGCTNSPRGRPATGVTILNCDVTGMMQANAAVARGQAQAVCLVPRIAVADQIIKIAEPVPK